MLTLDWTLVASAFIFLATLWALNALLFRPLLRILDERRELSSGTLASAERTLAQKQALEASCESKTREARQESYQAAEQVRREALAARQERVLQARDANEARLKEARLNLEGEVASVRKELGRTAEEVARLISSRVLEKS
jgi:F-type H+-transporting ATPase subunit b